MAIVGASSDHLVVDVTEAAPPVRLGDELGSVMPQPEKEVMIANFERRHWLQNNLTQVFHEVKEEQDENSNADFRDDRSNRDVGSVARVRAEGGS